MKKIFLLVSLLVTATSWATLFTQRIDTSSTNIGASFASGAANHMTFGNTVIHQIKSLGVNNRSSSEIQVNCSVTGATVPSDSASSNLVAAGNEAWVLDNAGFGNNCYVRSQSGTISSGIIVITAIGN